MHFLNDVVLPLENLLLNLVSFLKEDHVDGLVESHAFFLELPDVVEQVLVELEGPCLFEVAKQDSQEQVEHDDVTHQHEQDEEDCAAVHLRPHAVVHY